MSFHDYFADRFGQKVLKLSIDAGFTCPNRDGRVARSGCLFCGERHRALSELPGIREQMHMQASLLSEKWPSGVYIAYFKDYTNTYAPIDTLRRIYTEALSYEGVVGLAIATRADCLSEEVLDLLQELSETTFLWVELGMQTINENTIRMIRRGYDHEVLDDAVRRLTNRGIRIVCHIIFGLPGEDEADWMRSIDYVSERDLFGVKIHSLYIQSDSPIHELYLAGGLELLTFDRYVEAVCDAIAGLKPGIVLHRLTGDGDRDLLVAPNWSRNKLGVLASIHRRLKERNIVQGIPVRDK